MGYLPPHDRVLPDFAAALFDAFPQPIYLFDRASLRFLAVNDAVVRRYGYSRQEMLGMTVAAIHARDEMHRLAAHLASMTAAPAAPAPSMVWRQMHRGGAELFVELTSLLLDQDGTPALLTVAHEITDRLRMERAMESHQERARLAMEAAQADLWEWDFRNGRIEWDRDSAQLLGTMPGKYAVDADEFLQRVHADDRDALEKRLATTRRVPSPMRHEFRLEMPDGSLRWLETHARRRPGDPDPADRLVGVALDITGRKHAEAERDRLLQRLTLEFSHMPDGCIVCSTEHTVQEWNPAAAAIFGWSRADMVGAKPWDRIVPPELRAEIEARTRRLELTGDRDFHIHENLTRDGRRITCEWSKTLLRGHDGGPTTLLCMVRDVTEQVLAEQRSRQYVARIEQSMLGTVAAISRMVELRDPYTAGHERRVAEIASAIASEMGLDESRRQGLHLMGRLHDIGKIAVPAEILSKPTRLTGAEMALVRHHARAGHDILAGIEFPWPVSQAVLQHHERLDGSGYPDGLAGEAISLDARILAIADTVEAMTAHRPYRPGIALERTLAEVEHGAGAQFDPDAVSACLRLFRERGWRIPD
jgi:PAS domain S-box-containing protein